MEYPDIDYINDMLFYISELSYHVRKRKTLNEDVVQDLLTLTIQLMEILELYLNDKCNY